MGEHRYRERLSVEEQKALSEATQKRIGPLHHLRGGRSWPSVDDNDKLVLNQPDYVHGVVVTNRAERRAAQVEARRYGCELHADVKTGKVKHGLRCPKYEPPENERKRPPLLTSPAADEKLQELIDQRTAAVQSARGGKSDTLDLIGAMAAARGHRVIHEHVDVGPDPERLIVIDTQAKEKAAPEGAAQESAEHVDLEPQGAEGATMPPPADEVKPP